MSKFLSQTFENQKIRTMTLNNESWFVAQDVCAAVGIKNSRDAIDKLDADEKATVGLTDSQNGQGAQKISVVSESGLYILILRCRNAMKKGSAPYRFRKWVTAEVLPSIRKTGSYSLTITTEQQFQIKEAVIALNHATNEPYPTIYSRLYREFQVPKYQDLLAKDFERAMAFLNSRVSQPVQQLAHGWVNMPFNLKISDTYLVKVKNGKIRRMALLFGMPYIDDGLKPWSTLSVADFHGN